MRRDHVGWASTGDRGLSNANRGWTASRREKENRRRMNTFESSSNIPIHSPDHSWYCNNTCRRHVAWLTSLRPSHRPRTSWETCQVVGSCWEVIGFVTGIAGAVRHTGCRAGYGAAVAEESGKSVVVSAGQVDVEAPSVHLSYEMAKRQR